MARYAATQRKSFMDKLTVSRKALIFGVIVAAVFVLALTFAL
jgi:hypothetical protein